MLRELNVVEQRYRAVLEVLSGTPVIEVAERYGVARQTVHRWMVRYQAAGIDGLTDRSHAPKRHPWRIAADIEAVICELYGQVLLLGASPGRQHGGTLPPSYIAVILGPADL